MRNIATKADNVGNTLPADGFNSDQNELENIVLSTDQVLDPDLGPDVDLNMLGKAAALYGSAAQFYVDSGNGGDYNLLRSTNLKNVPAYKDGMVIIFKAINPNPGASIVDVNNMGVKNITLADGTALQGGEIITTEYTIAVFNSTNDRFELVRLITPATSVRDQSRGLIVKNNISTPISQVDIDCDEIILQDTQGLVFKATNVNLTADITFSGVNGLDTGAEAINTWYHIWTIYNPTTKVTASLLSISDTTPTMPAGYTFKGYSGAVYNNASSNFDSFFNNGGNVSMGQKTVLSVGNAATVTLVSLATAIPITAKSVSLVTNVLGVQEANGIWIGATVNFTDHIITLVKAAVGSGSNTNIYSQSEHSIVETQSIYYRIDGGNTTVDIIVSGYIL